MRIALIGHAVCPHVGSEPGITWNWATHLSKHHQVTLLSHPERRAEVEAELAERPRENLTIRWVTLPPAIDPWRPTRGERGIRLHYRLWQHAALKTLRGLHAREPFDLVHHVSWGALQQPPLVWKMGIPFVWGPVGGGQTWPARFQSYATRGGMGERARRLLVRLTPWNPPVVRAVRAADLVLATNSETETLLGRLGARRVECFPDYGTLNEWLASPARSQRQPGCLDMLWAGRCEPRKGIPLVLEAMAQVHETGVRLLAAGEGPSRLQWQAQARQLGLEERVQFLGQVPWKQMSGLFEKSDAFVFPSLRDSFGTVILEAMARRLPLVTLDHQGAGRILPADAGIKVPVTEPGATVRGLAEAMRTLAANPEARLRMGEAAAMCAAAQQWDHRAETMTRWYEEVLRAHRGV